MTKLKHNKKRNTAFLYETLVRELSKSVMESSANRKNKIYNILKEFFSKEKPLGKELSLYKSVVDTHGLNEYTAEKLLFETKMRRSGMDKEKIFLEQTELIKRINRELSKDVFNNFVPNYKNLATICQIFNNEDISIKTKVLLEADILQSLTSTKKEEKREMKPIDNLVFKSFVEKFNDKYGKLHEEQQMLLGRYITSFSDNGLGLKLYLNEEIERLQTEVERSLKFEEIEGDTEMTKKTKDVLEVIDDITRRDIDEDTLGQVLKIQNLVREFNDDDC